MSVVATIVVGVASVAAVGAGTVVMVRGARAIIATNGWTETERGRRGNRTLARGAALLFVGLAGLGFLLAQLG